MLHLDLLGLLPLDLRFDLLAEGVIVESPNSILLLRHSRIVKQCREQGRMVPILTSTSLCHPNQLPEGEFSGMDSEDSGAPPDESPEVLGCIALIALAFNV